MTDLNIDLSGFDLEGELGPEAESDEDEFECPDYADFDSEGWQDGQDRYEHWLDGEA